MADVQGALYLLLELIWTIIKVNYEIIRGMWRVLVPPEPKDVRGEIVLITGAGHGMGREMALRFARLGATIVSVDINAKGNEETARLIRQEKGQIHTYLCDVTNRAAVMELADKVKREVGDVTFLVNNAGIMPCNPVLMQTEKEIRLMNDININGNLWMIQAFLPAMIDRNCGHIVAMSSMAGLMGLSNLVPYCGAKYAVRGIMEALAIELREDPRRLTGIKFTTVCPYMVDTGLCKKPRIRFESMMKVVDPGEAADMIVNAVRREVVEITIPTELHYMNRVRDKAGAVTIDATVEGYEHYFNIFALVARHSSALSSAAEHAMPRAAESGKRSVFIYRMLPFPAACAWNEFFNTGVDAHN